MWKKWFKATRESKEERRRYPRLVLDEVNGVPDGACVRRDGRDLAVLDLSFTGLSIRRVPDMSWKENEAYDATLHLGEREVAVRLRVRRLARSSIGVEVIHLEDASRRQFEDFLTERLIGRNLRRIEDKHYDARSGFSDWYHGPQATDLFLWHDRDGQPSALEFHQGESVLHFTAGGGLRSEGPLKSAIMLRRLQALIQYAQEGRDLLAPFLYFIERNSHPIAKEDN